MMKIDEIKTIVELMSEHDLSEFRIDTDAMQLSIVRGCKNPVVVNQTMAAPMAMPAAMPVAQAPMQMPAPAAPAAPAVSESADAGSSAPQRTIDSPTVGTFYRASAPDAEAFVKVGDTVTADTVICIIEAMKVMNEIKAETSGVIKEILVENAQPVEFGQPLFVLA